MNSVKYRIQNQSPESSCIFICNNELSKREVKKTIPFTIVSERITYLEINLTKDVKDLHPENYKTVREEIEEDTNKWKHILCL